MNREQIIVGDMMWKAIGQQSREAWSLDQASKDPAVQGVMYIFAQHNFHDEAVKDTMKDALEEFIFHHYEVPRERSEEVFRRAEDLVMHRMESDGET